MNTDASNQLNTQSTQRGFDALAGGISKRFDQQRQDEQLKVKAAADASAAAAKNKSVREMELIKLASEDNPEIALQLLKKGGGELTNSIDFEKLMANKVDFNKRVDDVILSLKNSDREGGAAIIAKLRLDYPKKSAKIASTLEKGLESNVDPRAFTGKGYNEAKKLAIETYGPDATEEQIVQTRNDIAAQKVTAETQAKFAAEIKGNRNKTFNENKGFVWLVDEVKPAESSDSIASLEDSGKRFVVLKAGQLDEINKLTSANGKARKLVDIGREALTATNSGEVFSDWAKSKLANVPGMAALFPTIGKIKSYQDMANVAIAGIARTNDHTGVLTEQDLQKTFGALSNVVDPIANRELKNMIMEESIQNAERMYLLAKLDPNAFKKEQQSNWERVRRLADLAAGKTVKGVVSKKIIDGQESTFLDFFKKQRSNGLNMEQIEADWKAGGRKPLQVDMSLDNSSINKVQTPKEKVSNTPGFSIKGFTRKQ